MILCLAVEYLFSVSVKTLTEHDNTWAVSPIQFRCYLMHRPSQDFRNQTSPL